MRRLIDKDDTLKMIADTISLYGTGTKVESEILSIVSKIPCEEPWNIVKSTLNELERKEEKLYSDYCDTTARLKAINKIAKSSQKPNQKIDGIKLLAEMEVEDDY